MAAATSTSIDGVALTPSREKIEQKFDLGIALALSTWMALTLAVQNHWGGSNSAEKQDWFAGAISDLFVDAPDADSEYVEEFMLQIMNDEFDINVEDGSGEEVADNIVALRKATLKGDFTQVDDMMAKWEERRRKGADKVAAKFVDREQEDTDWDSDESEDDDVEMDDAPPSLVSAKPAREKPPPEIDEDGFTKVASKKKR